MRLSLLAILLSLQTACFSQLNVVHFKSSGYDIPDSSIAMLQQIVLRYNCCGDEIIIKGYADSTGADSLNDLLSLKRAQAVRDMLYYLGLTKPRPLTDTFWWEYAKVELMGSGSANPVASNQTKAGRQLNRRVEIFTSHGLCETYEEEPDLYALLKEEGEEFCVDPLRDTILVGKHGSIVAYKAGTFENVQGCSCLRLVVNEYYKKSSLILNNLSTTTNDIPLESGGMTRIVGYCGDDTSRFAPGKYLTVMVPADTVLPGMKLLSASREKLSDYLNWQIDKDFSELDYADWNALRIWCRQRDQFEPLKPEKCPFFFFRIRKAFKGRRERQVDKANDNASKEKELIKKYALDEKQLGDALLASKDANANVLKYYVFKNANWDYHNIDRYQKGANFIDFIVDEQVKSSTDVKMVYKQTKTVLPPSRKGRYIFKNVFDNREVWIVGLKYKDKTSTYVSFEVVNTSVKHVKLDFKEMTIEELKTLLRKLD